VLRNGLAFRVSSLLDLLILKETLVDDVYGLDELETAMPKTIVDVGASFGDFAIAAGRRFPEAEVLAFEPFAPAYELLRENIDRNDATNVSPARVAVGTEAPARRLDELLGGRAVDLLKIDCEGAELDVLRSAGDALASAKRLVVEYHRHLLPQADRLAAELLAAHGFRIRLDPDRFDANIGYLRARQ
jgi:precorrin-6B methylase 2